jgi:heme oxygenase
MHIAAVSTELTSAPDQIQVHPVNSLRHWLRAHTAAAHARLDAQLSGLGLSTPAGYRQFLEANAAALLPLEAALVESGVARVFPDWGARTRSEAIRADLGRMGGMVRPLPAPTLFGFEQALGAMYVLEGSRLGARVILRQIRASGVCSVTGATAYLRHGDGQPLWPSFLAELERHGAALSEWTNVAQGAYLAFDMFTEAVAVATHCERASTRSARA